MRVCVYARLALACLARHKRLVAILFGLVWFGLVSLSRQLQRSHSHPRLRPQTSRPTMDPMGKSRIFSQARGNVPNYNKRQKRRDLVRAFLALKWDQSVVIATLSTVSRFTTTCARRLHVANAKSQRRLPPTILATCSTTPTLVSRPYVSSSCRCCYCDSQLQLQLQLQQQQRLQLQLSSLQPEPLMALLFCVEC